jgi:hypothetical protein
MSPLEEPAGAPHAPAVLRRLRLRSVARALIGPLALAVGGLQALPAVLTLAGLRVEDALLGPPIAFLQSVNPVQLLLDLVAAGLFVLAGARLLGPRPDPAREEFSAALVVEGALFVSFLRSPLYGALLPWPLRAGALLALASLLFALVVLWTLFHEERTTPVD